MDNLFALSQLHIRMEQRMKRAVFHYDFTCGEVKTLMTNLCLVPADFGPGLLHDDVLPGSESRNLLRLAIDPTALQCNCIVPHQRGTDIEAPSSSSSSSSHDRLFSPTLSLFDIPSWMLPVHLLSASYQPAPCQCTT